MNYLPEQGLGYAFMINSGSIEAYLDIDRLVQTYLTRELAAPPAPDLATVPVADQERFSGYYRSDSPRQEVLRFVEGLVGTVSIRLDEKGFSVWPLFGTAVRMHAVSDRTFRGAAGEDQAEERVATAVLIDDPREGLAVQKDGTTFRKVSALSAWAERALVGSWLLMTLSAELFAPVWGLRWLIRRLRGWPTILMRAVPLAAVLCLEGVLFALSTDDLIARFGNFTFWSFGLFLATLGFGVLSVLGLWLAFRARKVGVNRWALLHSLGFSVANVLVTGYLAYWGWIGIRLWR